MFSYEILIESHFKNKRKNLKIVGLYLSMQE